MKLFCVLYSIFAMSFKWALVVTAFWIVQERETTAIFLAIMAVFFQREQWMEGWINRTLWMDLRAKGDA